MILYLLFMAPLPDFKIPKVDPNNEYTFGQVYWTLIREESNQYCQTQLLSDGTWISHDLTTIGYQDFHLSKIKWYGRWYIKDGKLYVIETLVTGPIATANPPKLYRIAPKLVDIQLGSLYNFNHRPYDFVTDSIQTENILKMRE